MADHLMAKVRADGKTVRCVEVRLRYNDMEQSRRSESLEEPTDLETDVYGVIDRLTRRAWDRRVSLRLVGLKLSRVYDGGGWHQAGLDLPGTGYDRETRRELARVMDEAKERYGPGSVVRAHQLQAQRSRQSSVVSRRGKPSARRQHLTHTQVSVVLNVKSCFSFMDSLLQPEDIVRLAAEQGARAVAMTDPNLHGAVEFCAAAKKAGIKPIVAAEVKVRGISYLAYVENAAGYRNLCGLLSGTNKNELDGLILRPTTVFPEIRYASARDAKFYEVLQSIRTSARRGIEVSAFHNAGRLITAGFSRTAGPGGDEAPLRRHAIRRCAQPDR